MALLHTTFLALVAMSSHWVPVRAGQCQHASCLSKDTLPKETLLLQRRATTASSQLPSEVLVDACGCTIGEQGWSSSKRRCSSQSQTDHYEAARCQFNTPWPSVDPPDAPPKTPEDNADPTINVDACGCFIGREGWSSTISACRFGSATDASEAAACQQEDPSDGLLTPPDLAVPGACLCVFDIDRTLTGKQDDVRTCPNNTVLENLDDHGYGGGNATLSALAAAGLSATFCNECFLGICSAGHGSGVGSPWNDYLLDHIMRSAPQDKLTSSVPAIKTWSTSSHVRSPYILGQRNRYKQDAVEGIRRWYGKQRIEISPSEVYFFGDRTENIEPFQRKGLNSREISCSARDHHTDGGIGYCGATANEIVRMSGNLLCSDVSGAFLRGKQHNEAHDESLIEDGRRHREPTQAPPTPPQGSAGGP